jgi:hypothetical protein
VQASAAVWVGQAGGTTAGSQAPWALAWEQVPLLALNHPPWVWEILWQCVNLLVCAVLISAFILVLDTIDLVLQLGVEWGSKCQQGHGQLECQTHKA